MKENFHQSVNIITVTPTFAGERQKILQAEEYYIK